MIRRERGGRKQPRLAQRATRAAVRPLAGELGRRVSPGVAARPLIMTSQHFRTRAVVALTMCLNACNRYEYRTFDCAPEAPATAASAIGWEATPRRNAIDVRVRSADAGEPMPAATIGARIDGAPWRAPGPGGVVRFDSVAAGRHVLTVRAFGHHPATETVVVPHDSGVVALAVMARDRTIFDEGCGFMRYRARKPWWKLW